jgi:asparagine synthase (glutamine-hydrolysing)
VGIEIGTYLLGQAAQGHVSYVFSGEGGDELFAGHPVYVAQKLAVVLDRFPPGIVKPLLRVLQRIPDSDRKANVQVKIKRFAAGLLLPPDLLGHRWRVQYRFHELKQLCAAEFLSCCSEPELFDDVIRYSRRPDGQDWLSRSLYNDYHTLVDFYLRRLRLLSTFAIGSRLPLLDYRLVEYAAQLPSQMKIHGVSDTKYIYKKALTDVLPDQILYGRPKLGNSVPLKMWLRRDPRVRGWIADILCDSCLRNCGFFHMNFIHRMLEEHTLKIHNHSHRLWGLAMLALWLKVHMGTPVAVRQ